MGCRQGGGRNAGRPTAVARPPQGQMHPGRQLGVLGLVFVVLYLAVFFLGGAKGGFTERLHPKLGLDLVGGTQATYIASVQGGQVPSKESMQQAKGIIENRVNALGVSEAEVVVQGDRNIVVSLAGKSDDQLKDLAKAAQMRFRLVIGATGDVSQTALNPPAAKPSASASAGASAKPSTSASAGAKASATAKPSSSTGGQGGGEVVRAPSPSVTPSAAATTPAATPTATPTPVAEAALPQATGDEKVTVADVQKKVGAAAWAAAEKLTAPVDLSSDPKAGLAYAAFGKLGGAEVNVLPAQMQ